MKCLLFFFSPKFSITSKYDSGMPLILLGSTSHAKIINGRDINGVGECGVCEKICTTRKLTTFSGQNDYILKKSPK